MSEEEPKIGESQQSSSEAGTKKDAEVSPEKPVPEVKSSEPEAHVSKYKKKVVKEIVKLMKEYPIVGAINMENMPAGSLARMRQQLREQCVIRMAKRRVMKYAFDEIKAEKKGINELVPHLKGMPALLFTKENPFSLFKFIKQKKSSAPAKAGQEAPRDIVVKAGPTPFVPGPVISELSGVGIKTEVKDGKIHIKEDAVVAKEGDVINAALAGLLQRLGIEPMEIGLDLVAVYEDGVIYDKKVLDIDEDKFMEDMQNAARWAFNLAVEVGHYTKETVGVLVPKAFREAKSVALEAGVMNDVTKEEILAKAEAQAQSLKAEAKIEVGAAKSAPKEEVKPEEKKEEAPKVEAKPAEEPKVEEKKEEVKEEPAPVEEKKEEPAPEEPKVEEKKEEEKPAEPAPEVKEEPKVEEKPVEESKPEEPKVEEKKEEPKVEAPEAEVKEAPKAEAEAKPEPELPDTSKVITDAIEKNEEAKKEKEETITPENVEEKEEEVKEELEEIKEKVEAEEKDPDSKEITELQEEVKEVEEKLEKVEDVKEKIPPTEKIIIQKKEEPKVEERQIDPEKQKKAQEGEALFEQLKKKGTLRGVEKEEVKRPSEPKSPQEIIAEAHKKMEKDEVPSAHELLKKKLQKK
ncbi:MAG: 50S ribosomal protein L10 [Candidatus Woesearchaeota archaeon]